MADLGSLLRVESVERPRHSAALLARFSPDGDPEALMQRFFDKADIRIGRLIAFAIFFQFALLLVTVAWGPLAKALGWFLLPLGQSALLAYSTHLFVIALFTHYAPRIPALRNTSALANTFVQAAGIGLVFAVVQLAPVLKQVAVSTRETVVALVAPSNQILVVPRHVVGRRSH